MAGRKIQSIRLSEARTLYLEDMRSLGKSANTVRCANAPLVALERVIGNKVVRNIDKKDINDYYTVRSNPPAGAPVERLSVATLNLHTTWLQQFFRWCVEEAYAEPTSRPMRGRGKIKFVPRPRARLVQEDFDAVLAAAPNPRDRIVLALGIYTMCRASEIRTLRIGDVSLTAGTMAVTRWKTRASDTLPLCAEIHDELANYLMWYSLHVGSELQPEWLLAPTNTRRVAVYDPATQRLSVNSPLILTPEREMWQNGYAKIVQAALAEIGWTVAPGEGMHTLRRSGARELFDQLRTRTGFDDALLTVMSMLGHAKPDTTLLYLGVDREATRRNTVLAGNVMYPRAAAARQVAVGSVVSLRAVE